MAFRVKNTPDPVMNGNKLLHCWRNGYMSGLAPLFQRHRLTAKSEIIGGQNNENCTHTRKNQEIFRRPPAKYRRDPGTHQQHHASWYNKPTTWQRSLKGQRHRKGRLHQAIWHSLWRIRHLRMGHKNLGSRPLPWMVRRHSNHYRPTR